MQALKGVGRYQSPQMVFMNSEFISWVDQRIPGFDAEDYFSKKWENRVDDGVTKRGINYVLFQYCFQGWEYCSQLGNATPDLEMLLISINTKKSKN